MASIAELLIQGQTEAAAKGPGFAEAAKGGVEAYSKVAQIALAKEENALKAQELQKKKEELVAAKFKNVMDYVGFVRKSPDLKFQNIGMKNLPQVIGRWGAEDMFSPELVQAMQQSPEVEARIRTVADRVAKGELTTKDGIDVINNMDQLVKVQPSTEPISEAAKIFLDRQAKIQAQQAQIASSEKKQQTQIASAGDIEEAKRTAADFVKFNAGGGFAGLKNKLTKLTVAINDLKQGKVNTGGLGGFAQSVLPEAFTSVTDPKQKVAMDTIRGAISLKGQLDSQFSAKEAQIQFNRAFDPALPTAENIVKANAMLSELQDDIRNKLAQFVRTGRIKQEEADKMLKSLDSIQSATEQKKQTLKLGDQDLDIELLKSKYPAIADKEKFLKDLSARSGKSIGEIKKLLGL